MVTYGQDPPGSYMSVTNPPYLVSTEDYINMSRSFWAINVGGICLCLVHILSAVLHFIRPLHKIAKPFQMLSHLFTIPFLIMATLWRFCEGGIVCATNINITYPNSITDFSGFEAAVVDEGMVEVVGLFMYRWIITSWCLLPVACCLGMFC
jgi:hypothetical protein